MTAFRVVTEAQVRAGFLRFRQPETLAESAATEIPLPAPTREEYEVVTKLASGNYLVVEPSE